LYVRQYKKLHLNFHGFLNKNKESKMNFFKKLKIRTKLLIGFLSLIVFLVIVGLYSANQVNGFAASGVYVYENYTEALGDIALMIRDYSKLRMNYRDIRLLTEPEAIKKQQSDYTSLMQTLLKHNGKYALQINDEGDRKAFTQYDTELKTWERMVMEVFSAKQDPNVSADKVADLFAKGVVVGTKIAEETLQALADHKITDAKRICDENSVIADDTFIVLIAIVFVSIIIAVVLMVAIISNFGTLFRKIIDDVYTLNGESDKLSEVSDAAASGSVELQSQTQTAASSSEQVSANVTTVATAIEELAASIKEISLNTTSATALTKKSEDRANEASEVMGTLGKSSHEIGNIIKSITDIAEQTNLLALNATIEAARAGEMGKGFAVVANEVKELAKESAKATEDITKKIKAIQDGTENAIEVIKEIIDNAVKINEVTTTIASAVEEQSVTATEVNRNISEASVGVQSIVEVIGGITKATIDYAEEAEKIKAASAALNLLADDLNIQVKANFSA
jgi:methyl-accepting chemotaxis protein